MTCIELQSEVWLYPLNSPMIDAGSYIRAINFLGFGEFVSRFGLDYSALLQEVELTTEQLDDLDALIPFRKYMAFVDLAASRSNRTHFLLEAVEYAAPDFAFCGPVLFLSRFTKTAEEFFVTANRYWHDHTNAYTVVLVKDPEKKRASIRVSSDAFLLPSRHIEEAVLSAIVGIYRVVTNRRDAVPVCVRFQQRQLPDTTVLENWFRAPIEFGCDVTELEIDDTLLQQSTHGGLRVLKPVMALFMNERIKRIKNYDHSFTRTVSLAIPSLMGSGNCNIETVAEALGTNAKQLQRMLAKENTHFSAILEDVRSRRAKQWLSETEAPIGRIAGLLDYSANAPFTTAFQKWTGMTPMEYRKSTRQ